MTRKKTTPGKKRPKAPSRGKKKGSRNPRADHFFSKAKTEGYAARSVYKLEEIDRKYRLFQPGMRVLDLGCHPGSWMQYISKAVLAKGFVLGVDRKETEPPEANARTIQADILEPGEKAETLFEAGFHAVCSDMAPDTTGIGEVDEARSLELVEAARKIAEKYLFPGGFLLIKLFQGPGTKAWMEKLSKNFFSPQIIRPKATRKESREIFVLCRGFHSTRNDCHFPQFRASFPTRGR